MWFILDKDVKNLGKDKSYLKDKIQNGQETNAVLKDEIKRIADEKSSLEEEIRRSRETNNELGNNSKDHNFCGWGGGIKHKYRLHAYKKDLDCF